MARELRQHCAQIDPAAEKDTERHITDRSAPDGFG